MSDLPERLRGLVDDTQSVVISDALEEAADEIERLAAAQQDAREALKKIVRLCSGDRHTVNEANAFEHFGKLNRTMVEVREIARGGCEQK